MEVWGFVRGISGAILKGTESDNIVGHALRVVVWGNCIIRTI